jgi:hypothetical protein
VRRLQDHWISTAYIWSGLAVYAVAYALLYLGFDWRPKEITVASLVPMGLPFVVITNRAKSASGALQRALAALGEKPPPYFVELVRTARANPGRVDDRLLDRYIRIQKAHMLNSGVAFGWVGSLLFMI